MDYPYYIITVAINPYENVLEEHGYGEFVDKQYSNYEEACMRYVETKPRGKEEVRLIQIAGEDEDNGDIDWYVCDRKHMVV